MHWYIDVLKKYAVFTGRAGRKEFWMFTLWHVSILCIFIFAEILAAINYMYDIYGDSFGAHKVIFIIAGVYYLATLLPALGAGVKRLHDVGLSGWYMALAIVPNIQGFMLGFDPQFFDSASLLSNPRISWVCIIFFISIFSRQSQMRSNRYGSCPLDVSETWARGSRDVWSRGISDVWDMAEEKREKLPKLVKAEMAWFAVTSTMIFIFVFARAIDGYLALLERSYSSLGNAGTMSLYLQIALLVLFFVSAFAGPRLLFRKLMKIQAKKIIKNPRLGYAATVVAAAAGGIYGGAYAVFMLRVLTEYLKRSFGG